MNVVFTGMTVDNTVTCKSHSHSHWEILYYLSGTGVLKVGSEEIPFQPGDIVCQPPHIPHSEVSMNGFYNIHIRVNDFTSPGGPVPRFKDNNNLDIRNIVMFLYREYHLRQKNWSGLVDTLFQVLYQYMLMQSQSNAKSPYVKELENILVSNISNPDFHIADAQEGIPLSDFYLKRLFKKETGVSPIEYLTQKRIAYSKQLLEGRSERTLTIKEIAGMVGYSDPYYFSRVFKKVTGKSPSEYS